MKKDMVTKSALGLEFNLAVGDVVRLYKEDPRDDYAGRKKKVLKTYKITGIYPYMFMCRDFEGHTECFPNACFYDGEIEKVSI